MAKSAGDLSIHILEMHPPVSSTSNAKKSNPEEFTCPICEPKIVLQGYKNFSDHAKELKHGNLICDVCNLVCTKLESKAKHLINSHQDKLCPFCYKRSKLFLFILLILLSCYSLFLFIPTKHALIS